MEHKRGFNVSAGVKRGEVWMKIKFLADTARAGVNRFIRRIIHVINVLVE